MLDLGTLESQTDCQILLRLIALLTSLIAASHRDHFPSSTPCRNGPACSYGTRCWCRHAAPHVLPATVPSQRHAATWRSPSRPSAARAQLASSPPSPLPPASPSPAHNSSTAPPSRSSSSNSLQSVVCSPPPPFLSRYQASTVQTHLHPWRLFLRSGAAADHQAFPQSRPPPRYGPHHRRWPCRCRHLPHDLIRGDGTVRSTTSPSRTSASSSPDYAPR